MEFEEFVEGRLIREVHLIDDLLDRHVGVFQHVLGFQDQEGVDPFRRGTSGHIADQFGQVFRRNAQLGGIECQIVLGHVMLGHQVDEAVHHRLGARRMDGLVHDLSEMLLSPERAQEAHHGRYK